MEPLTVAVAEADAPRLSVLVGDCEAEEVTAAEAVIDGEAPLEREGEGGAVPLGVAAGDGVVSCAPALDTRAAKHRASGRSRMVGSKSAREVDQPAY